MIGLDIGTYSIKAVEIQKKNDSLLFSNYKIQRRSAASGSLPQELKSFFETVKFSTKNVAISVSGQACVVRIVELPDMAEEELKKAVRFEIERYLPYRIEDAVLDFKIISKNIETKKAVVLFASARKDIMLQNIESISQLGFTVSGVDIDGIALTNAFLSNPISKSHTEKDKAVALFNIGESFLNISIVYNEIPYVVRDIAGSGKDFAEDIAKGLGLNKNQAYEIMINPPDDKKEAIADFIRPSLMKMVKESRLSVGYFENQYGKGVDSIYVSGGTSGCCNMLETLSESLEVQVENWDPFVPIEVDADTAKLLDDKKHELAIAVGLALRDD